MTGQSFPNDMIGVGEKLTTEEWKEITKNWHLTNKAFVILARKRSYGERCIASINAFLKLQGKIEPDYNEFISALHFLSDEALDRIIASFTDEDRERLKEFYD